jgi:stage II sporulation protein D
LYINEKRCSRIKKIVLSIALFILICFLIPIVFTNGLKPKEEVQKAEVEEPKESVSTYDYRGYTRIRLLRSETGEVEEILIDEYLYGVVASEMPASFHMEALRAQAIATRTYTLHSIIHKNKHENADICDNFACCQAWISKEDRFSKWIEGEREENWRKIVEAVNSTQGKIITYEGEIIEALFHANSGGKTEIAVHVWGGSEQPYLHAVETSR